MNDFQEISAEQLMSELHRLIAGVLDVDLQDVPLDRPIVDALGIDSVMVMQILVVLRRTYRVEFEDADLMRLQPACILEICDMVLEKLRAQHGPAG
jgi:acyl carrier protein